MHKKSVLAAIEKYSKKQIKNSARSKRPNKKPEKETERLIMPILKSLGIFASVVDASAVYSQSAGCYLYGQAEPGFPDIVGLNDLGQFLAIELKAKGKRSNASQAQIEFLTKVINQNGFACVTDRPEHFVSIYSSWKSAPVENKKQILFDDLPRSKVEAEDLGLFDE